MYHAFVLGCGPARWVAVAVVLRGPGGFDRCRGSPGGVDRRWGGELVQEIAKGGFGRVSLAVGDYRAARIGDGSENSCRRSLRGVDGLSIAAGAYRAARNDDGTLYGSRRSLKKVGGVSIAGRYLSSGPDR